ncbi:hypothetical protein PEC18_12230 [Paucibacter sp. O1-1]|nr:hypothetical protein [Paucibacter sp. O1-1]MDA3826584.1 hypothetical protein [Paucibacter sp. O1-1]
MSIQNSFTKPMLIGLASGVVAAVVTWFALQAAAPSAPSTIESPPTSRPAAPAVPPPEAPRAHLYDSRDGASYGYTAQLSDVQRQAGQVANSIVMISYAGNRDGRHQVHLHEGQALVGYECSAPCDVIKVMTVLDVDGLRNQVRVEHLRSAPNMIAAMALQDAMSGRLEPYTQDYDEIPYELWIDQTKGLTRKRSKVKP